MLGVSQQAVAIDDAPMQRAFALRDRSRVTSGLYVALVERLNCPILTTGGRLARADPPGEVIFVGTSG